MNKSERKLAAARFDLKLYVSRGLEDEFLSWARQTKPTEERLRLIVGPPGSGKTWFMKRLCDQLRADKAPTFWLDCATVLDTGDPHAALHAWLLQSIDDLDAHLFAAYAPDLFSAYDPDLPLEIAWARVLRAVGKKDHRPVVLFVNALDEIDPRRRDLVDQFVLPSLLGIDPFSPRAVVAARDPFTIHSPYLKATPHFLQELSDDDQKALLQKYVARLKEIVARGSDVESISDALDVTAPSDDDFSKLVDLIKHLDSAELEGMASNLSGNPYVAVSLLAQTLLANLNRPTLTPPDSAAKEGVLARYLEDRAGIGKPPVAHSPLQVMKALVTVLDNPALWSQRELVGKHNERNFDFTFEDLEPYFEAGLIRQVRGMARYEIDPTIVGLVKS